ncbi:MAG: lipoprotein insertase outer membrane protein LolB [Formivibrio sp.]|nr:lipoprotein insertase outer membrane protein LolB [Formivibrio sp.]
MIKYFLLLIALALAGCAGMKLPPAPQDGFSANGRVSIRSGNDAHYANFGWQAEPQTDRLSLGNPLGQTLAQLEIHYLGGQPSYAILSDADGKTRKGTPEALLFDATGMRLPVAGLRWWLQGVPAPGAAESHAVAEGQLIEQDGWRILASDFSETQPTRRGPRKIELTRGDVSVRIVISEWQWQTSPQP